MFHFDFLMQGNVVMGLGLATVVSLLVGTVWYHPNVFGKKWQKLAGVKAAEAEEMAKAMGGKTLSSLLMAAVIACLAKRIGLSDMAQGAELGMTLWLGFMMPGDLDSYLFGKKPFELFMINSGCNLVQAALMSSIVVHFLVGGL